MKKSDLENGMVVENNYNELGIIIDNSIRYEIGFDRLSIFDDNLTYKDSRINKVYRIKNQRCSLLKIFDKENLELVWERPKLVEKEIDWSKIPKGTKVIATDHLNKFYENEGFEALFIQYEPQLKKYPFIVVLDFDEDVNSFKYCKVHPSVKIKEEWYKED